MSNKNKEILEAATETEEGTQNDTRLKDIGLENQQLSAFLDAELQKNAALEAEVERLTSLLEALQKEAEAYRAQLEKALAPAQKTATSSVVFETEHVQKTALERPLVGIHGAKYRFVRGRFHVLGKVYLATEAAADESLCARLLLEFPQLLEAVAE